MIRKFFALIFFLLILTSGFGQELKPRDVIILKNGEKYSGQIILKSDETVMLQTDDGKRYQFQTAEIKEIEREKIKSRPQQREPKSNSNLGVLAELRGGIARSKSISLTSPETETSVAIGLRNAFGSKAFVGIGSGLDFIFAKDELKKMTFIPIFIQIHKNLTDNQIKPFIGTKIGYAIGVNENYKGGLSASLSSGINIPVSGRTSINIGIFGKIQQINGAVTEWNELGEFSKNGTAPIGAVGLNFSFLF